MRSLAERSASRAIERRKIDARTRTQRLNPHNSQCETQGTRAGSTSGVHFLIQGLEVVAIMACLIYPGAAFSVTSVSQTLSVIAYRCSSTRRIRYPRRVS